MKGCPVGTSATSNSAEEGEQRPLHSSEELANTTPVTSPTSGSDNSGHRLRW